MAEFWNLLTFFLLIPTLSYWSGLIFVRNRKILNLSKFLVFLSNAAFFLFLFVRWIKEKYFPLSNLYESLIFLCWILSAGHLCMEEKTKSRLIGCISTPTIFLLYSFSHFLLPIEMRKATFLVPSLQSNWLMMHVSMMMISYSALILGSLFSILYLIFSFFSQKKKKEKNISTKNTLLNAIDFWSYRIIGLGFSFLTIGIISGAVWANEAWGSYWSWDPKEIWAFLTWLIFAIYLHARYLKGWKGQKAAFISSCGFFIIWICYLGVNFLAQGLHTYGWIQRIEKL